MRIDVFKIEEWMNIYCEKAKYDLCGTCIEPLSIKDLLILCDIQNTSEINNKKLTYGDIYGSPRLKTAIQSLYEKQTFENITVTHGAIGANHLVFNALLDKISEVISIVPAYQQQYSVPKSLCSNVKLLTLKEENNWLPNLNELENMISARTRLICFNNPNNPTGSVIPDDMLEQIAKIAEKHNIWVLSDEVYRGLNLNGNSYSKSIADIYEKGISTGSMSKTYSLPGLRVGWICARKDLINEINKHREYNTISVSMLDDYFSSIALENRQQIECRNFKIMRQGYEVLKNWLNSELYVNAQLPQGGTTVFVRYKKEIPSITLCKGLQEESGVAIIPGKIMDMEGYVRIGYCNNKEVLEKGLSAFSSYLRKF